METELKITGDGTHTLFVPELDEHYHSIHGAMQESIHVFMEAGLNNIKKQNIKILEIGFGTGLNALLSLHYGFNNKLDIDYHTLELFPVSIEKIHQLNYTGFFPSRYSELFNIMHLCSWERAVEITENFRLTKFKADFQKFEIFDSYDLIFFDAFGPDKQPEMWILPLMQKLYNCMNIDGILTTYSVKGEVKRNLKQAGFEIELIPGPPGKRVMLRASKILN